jgi:beta-lactamase regulating signal transducer with metallopeptidase domain
MIADAMGYAALIAMLFTFAAACSERLVANLGRPRRFVWLAALVASLLIPVFALLTASNPTERQEGLSWNGVSNAFAAVSGSRANGSLPTLGTAHDWDSMLLWLWAFVTVAMLIFFVRAWVRFSRTVSRQQIVLIDGQPARITSSVGPAVFGLCNPTILMPHWLLSASPATRAAAMAHELEHIATRDHLLLAMTQLIVIFLPWNLSLWWLLHRLRLAIEMDCDARVLRRGIDPVTYSEALLEVNQRRSGVPMVAAALTEPVTQLERRIRTMLRKERPLSAIRLIMLLTFTTALAACAAQLKAPDIQQVTNTQYNIPRERIHPEVSSNGVEISSDTIQVMGPGSLVDHDVTLLSGNVVLRMAKTTPVRLDSDQMDRTSAGDVFQGHVQFSLDQMTITTRRAVLKHVQEGGMIVTMDNATITRSVAAQITR